MIYLLVVTFTILALHANAKPQYSPLPPEHHSEVKHIEQKIVDHIDHLGSNFDDPRLRTENVVLKKEVEHHLGNEHETTKIVVKRQGLNQDHGHMEYGGNVHEQLAINNQANGHGMGNYGQQEKVTVHKEVQYAGPGMMPINPINPIHQSNDKVVIKKETIHQSGILGDHKDKLVVKRQGDQYAGLGLGLAGMHDTSDKFINKEKVVIKGDHGNNDKIVIKKENEHSSGLYGEKNKEKVVIKKENDHQSGYDHNERIVVKREGDHYQEVRPNFGESHQDKFVVKKEEDHHIGLGPVFGNHEEKDKVVIKKENDHHFGDFMGNHENRDKVVIKKENEHPSFGLFGGENKEKVVVRKDEIHDPHHIVYRQVNGYGAYGGYGSGFNNGFKEKVVIKKEKIVERPHLTPLGFIDEPHKIKEKIVIKEKGIDRHHW